MPIKPFKDLSLVDDFIFGEIMRKPENIKPFLEALLEKEIAQVVVIDKQKDLKDEYDAHGIRLDVYLEDEHRTKYDVEVQARLHPKLEKRIRYYQSGIDRHSLETESEYEELNDSYVIFICANDYFGAGLAVYERESHIKGAPEIPYEDGSHAFILNADFKKENANKDVLDFLRYIRAGSKGESFDVSQSSYLKKIDTAVKEIKRNSGREMEYMTLAMKMHDERWAGREEGRAEGLEEGMEKGAHGAQIRMAQKLLARNMSPEEIADICGLDLLEVKKLEKDV